MKFKVGDLIKIDPAKAVEYASWYFRDKDPRQFSSYNVNIIDRKIIANYIGEVINITNNDTVSVWWPQLNGYNHEHFSWFIPANSK